MLIKNFTHIQFITAVFQGCKCRPCNSWDSMSDKIFHGVEHASASGSSYYAADCLSRKCSASGCPSFDINKCMLEDPSISAKAIVWFRHEDVAGVASAPNRGTEADDDAYGEKQKGITNTQMIHNCNAQRARVRSRAEGGATTPATAGNQAVEEWVPITHGPRPCDPALRHHRQKRV